LAVRVLVLTMLSSSGKEGSTTKAEYNRQLLKQENAKMAEQARQAAEAGKEMIRERQRKHATEGLSRQQEAMSQMKRASESLDQHRQQNRAVGKKVLEDVHAWRAGAQETKEAWAAHAKAVSAELKGRNGAAEAVKANKEVKQKQAAATRSEDKNKEAERDRLRQQHEKQVSALAQTVRAATSDDIVDASKRGFFEQRTRPVPSHPPRALPPPCPLTAVRARSVVAQTRIAASARVRAQA
jgi:hypothetical protein